VLQVQHGKLRLVVATTISAKKNGIMHGVYSMFDTPSTLKDEHFA